MFQLFRCSDRVFYCVCYLAFALPLMLFFAFYIPAFQVPDESSHFARAYQLTHGELFPTRQAVPDMPGEYTLGGTVDPGIYNTAAVYVVLQRGREARLSPAEKSAADKVRWQGGEPRDIRSVSIYAPTFYLVSTAGVALGQFFDLSIVETLTLSRVLNGTIALLLVVVAMFFLRKGIGVFFVLMLMPMTLAQIGSTSQDAMCIATAALCVALFSRLSPELPLRRRRILLSVSSLFLIALAGARPPYLALSLFYLYYAYTHRAEKVFVTECCLAFFATILVAISWALYVTLFVSVPFGLEGFNYSQQAQFILQSPLEWLGILAETWRQRWEFYFQSFIGIVGHLDTHYPGLYYVLAGLALLLAFFLSFFPYRNALPRALREQAMVPWMIAFVVVFGLFVVLYISWSPLKNPVIEGVQGRYFIPAALFLCLGAAAGSPDGTGQPVYRCMILAFAVVTAALTPYTVFARYY